MSPKATLRKRYPVRRSTYKAGWLCTRAPDEALDGLCRVRVATGISLTILAAKALEIGAKIVEQELAPVAPAESPAMQAARHRMNASLARCKDFIGIDLNPALPKGKVTL